MTKNIRILYLYVVSFVTLGMIVGGIIGAATNLTSYYHPVVYYFNYYHGYYGEVDFDGSYTALSNEESALQIKNYRDEYAKEKENEKRRSLRDFFTCIALLLISIPLYVFHFRATKKIGEGGE